MLSIATGILALASAINPQLTDQDYLNLWSQFAQQYGKVYSSAEQASRFPIFKENVAFISEWNAAGNSSIELALNEFADMSQSEFAELLGYRAPQNVRQPDLSGAHLPESLSTSLPKSLDWTKKNVVSPIKNQDTCGSCYAFTAVAAVESAFAIQNGTLLVLSEQQLIDCAVGSYGCYGGHVEPSFLYAKKFGLCLSSAYPYARAQQDTCAISECQERVKISGFNTVKAGDEVGLQLAVFKQPVAVSLKFGTRALQFYSKGVIMADSCSSALDHSALLVGYGDGDLSYWKIKNSWGASWGLKGYALVERGSDACGIASQASYPVM